MDYEKHVQGLMERVPQCEVLTSVRMDGYTTFKIGGPVDLMIIPKSLDELRSVVLYLNEVEIPWMVLGNGSNLLVRDKGIRGAVLLIEKNMEEVNVQGCEIVASAGVLLSKLSKIIARQALTGFEFASGIPGTLGGGIVMNAGAYDGEMKDVVTWVLTMDREGNLHKYNSQESEFGYRHSRFQESDEIILSAGLTLHKGDPEAIDAKIREFTKLRTSKQPLDKGSAGSTFKRPTGYFAGKLIMDAGLSGYAVGDAQVSPKHCGFVVNNQGASCQDVLTVIQDVRDRVKSLYGVELETEIKIVGEE